MVNNAKKFRQKPHFDLNLYRGGRARVLKMAVFGLKILGRVFRRNEAQGRSFFYIFEHVVFNNFYF